MNMNGMNPMGMMLGGMMPTPPAGSGVILTEEEQKALEEAQAQNVETVETKEVEDSVEIVEHKADEDIIPVEPPKSYDIPRIAKFEKVSFEEFCRAYKPIYVENAKQMAIDRGEDVSEGFAYSEEEFTQIAIALYENIKLPKRSTSGSAGYDFFYPYGRVELVPNSTCLIPTGIKCKMEPGWVLLELPKSGLGFNYRVQMDNTVGVIDSDYYNNPTNEGHIMIKITNDSRNGQVCVFDDGNKYCQGVFVPYGITEDDDVQETRQGGFGSTGK